MKSIDNLIEAMTSDIRLNGESRYYTSIRAYVASQNLNKVRLAVACVAYELRHGKRWEHELLSESEVNAHCINYLQTLYLSFNVLVEVLVKPWPFPGGDFLSYNVRGVDQVYVDLEEDESFIAAITGGDIDDPALLP